MAKVTWLGEDIGKIAGPSFTTCFGDIHFDKGVPVEITDPSIVSRAKANQFFKVEDDHAPVKTSPVIPAIPAYVAVHPFEDDVPVKRGPGRPPNPPKVDHDDKDS